MISLNLRRTRRMAGLGLFALTGIMLLTPSGRAEQTSREVWLKAKCALCHGVDGSSHTDAGVKTHAPDLRAPATQKLTDKELAKISTAGHKRMPSFQRSAGQDKVRLMVAYIRSLALPAPLKDPPRPYPAFGHTLPAARL